MATVFYGSDPRTSSSLRRKGSEDLFVVNLWGYHLTVKSIEEKGKVVDYQVDIKCDVEEVLRYSRAKTTNAGKRNMAPTLPNPLRNELVSSRNWLSYRASSMVNLNQSSAKPFAERPLRSAREAT